MSNSIPSRRPVDLALRWSPREPDPRRRWPTQITSRPFRDVARELALSPRLEQVRGRRVVSIGEGFSNFAKTLEDAGADVIAADPVYALSHEQLGMLWLSGGEDGTEYGLELSPKISDWDPEVVRKLTLTPDEALARLPTRRVAADLAHLDLDPASCDLVCMNHVLEYLRKPGEALAGLEKVIQLTAPGGAVHCSLYTTQYAQLEPLVRSRHPGIQSQHLGRWSGPLQKDPWILTLPADSYRAG